MIGSDPRGCDRMQPCLEGCHSMVTLPLHDCKACIATCEPLEFSLASTRYATLPSELAAVTGAVEGRSAREIETAYDRLTNVWYARPDSQRDGVYFETCRPSIDLHHCCVSE